MKKPFKAAPPVASESRLREVEILARERIASMKQDDPIKGSETSATLSQTIQMLEPAMQCGTKVKEGAFLGHVATHGTTEEKLERQSKIRQTYYEVKEAHPGWLEKQIVAELVERLGFSKRTVIRYKPLLKK